MPQRKLIITYQTTDGDKCSVVAKDIKTFLAKVDMFLKNSCEFRAIFRVKDEEAKVELLKLFEKYASNYSTDDTSNSAMLAAVKGAGSGLLDASRDGVMVVAGLSVLELGADTLGDFVEILGEEVVGEILSEVLGLAADVLHIVGEVASAIADLTTHVLVPGLGLVRMAVRARRYYRKAQQDNENALMIVTFSKEHRQTIPTGEKAQPSVDILKSATPQLAEKKQLLPPLMPIPDAVLA